MPVADTELLFLLNPRDPRHRFAIKALERLRGRLYVPDAAILEFETVLRSRGRSADQVRKALSALKKVFIQYSVREVGTLSTDTLLLHLDIMEGYGLSYFDSLIATAAIVVDGVVVSDDDVFDSVKELKKRIPITE